MSIANGPRETRHTPVDPAVASCQEPATPLARKPHFIGDAGLIRRRDRQCDAADVGRHQLAGAAACWIIVREGECRVGRDKLSGSQGGVVDVLLRLEGEARLLEGIRVVGCCSGEGRKQT